MRVKKEHNKTIVDFTSVPTMENKCKVTDFKGRGKSLESWFSVCGSVFLLIDEVVVLCL